MIAVLEYIFARVSYVTKQKVTPRCGLLPPHPAQAIQEAQKNFMNRHVDLDEFLSFLMSQWHIENSRSEEVRHHRTPGAA